MIDHYKELRIVFMGTPDFAAASLEALVKAKCNIGGVITAPDKPGGRGQGSEVARGLAAAVFADQSLGRVRQILVRREILAVPGGTLG